MAEFYERFTVEEELKFFRDMELQNSRISSYEKTATPSLAQTVGDIYQKYSSANPGVLLAVAQGIDNGLMTSDVADKLLQDTIQTEMDETADYGIGGKDGKTSWYERNVFNNVKTGVKYTTAGLNTLYEFGQGALAKTGAALAGQGSFLDVFDDGWFISTSLGSLIENGDESGYGWFIGGKANELQAQRARDYRGEVAGHAWTLGRGVAHVFFQPNYEQNAVADGLENAAFSILSGGIDAMFALKTPALPGLGKIANAAGSFKGAVGMRVVDGLATWESAAILPSRVARWMDSTAGRKTIEFLAEDVDTVDKAMAVFPNSNTVWWQNIINTDNVHDMRTLLEEGLGMRKPDVGLAPRRIQDFNVGYWNGAKMRLNQYDSYVPRLFNRMISPVYDRDVVLAFGNDRDVAQSMKNLSNSMIAFGVKSERRQELLADFLDAYNNNRGALAGVSKQYRNIMEEALTAAGTPKAAVNSMLDGWIEFGNNLKYGVSKIENDQIVGDNFSAWIWADDGQRYWAPTSTAGALPEVAKHTLVLPDPRRVRRILNDDPVFKHMFSTTGWALGKTSWFDPADYGKARLPQAAIEAFQQEVWRPFVLMTGGYIMRNISDSALRLRMQTDLLKGAFHPLDYILLAAGKKGLGDIEGITFEVSRNKILDAKGEFGEAMNTTIRELDPRAVAAQERWTGLWEFAPKANTNDFIKGVADEISLLAKDEIAMRIALGEPTKDIVDFLTTTPRGQQIVRDLGEMWKNVEMVPVGGGAQVIRSADFTGVNGAASLRRYIETYMAPRVRTTTGGYPSLIDAIAKGEFTDANGNLVKAFQYTSGATPRYIGTNSEFFDEIARIAADPANTLKDIYKKRVELDPRKIRGRYEGRPGLERVGEFTDKMVDMFFGNLYTKNEAILNRSPAFRRYYYNEIDVLLDNLQPAEAPRIFDNIMKVAKERKVDVSTLAKQRRFVRQYLGDKKLADKIVDLKRGKITTNGQRTLGEIDSIAKGYALDSTKELFYNAASRSNFTDIMRIAAPFGKAWAEVMQSWLKIATANPNQFRKSAIMVKGLRDSDPEGDGKGFFYRNPTNGEYYFNFPWSEQLAPLFGVYGGAALGFFVGGIPGSIVGGATGARVGDIAQRQLGGVSPEAIFPARSLNMGTQITPGFGPVVQMAAEKILGNNPKYDDWVNFFSPYGFSGIEQAFPAWLRKSYDAVFGNPETSRVLGDIYLETLAALSASGDYDLSNQNEIQRLDKDALSKSRVLLMLRSFGQFIGPARPEIDFTIETEQGDVMASELSKAYYDMRDQNPETATLDFLRLFGDDVFIYMAGKSRSQVEGLLATDAFGDWERNNPEFKDTHPDAWAWFAPDGSQFDYGVWRRQIETGEREQMTGKERIELAQQIIGAALTRNVKSKMPADPTDADEEWLDEKKRQIDDLYPGYAKREININRIYDNIISLTAAANDPLVEGEPVAEALKTYFSARDQFIVEAIDMGLKGEKSLRQAKALSYARAELRSLADRLINDYPTFARVYDSVLAYEIEEP